MRVADLVDLVEDEDRVLRPGPPDPLDDPAGQRADVGPPVPPDLRLVPDTAKADPDVLPTQGIRDAPSEACLARARRAHEEEDRALLLLLELHDRQMLDDALLDLLEAVVVAIQDAAGLFDVDALLLLNRPGKVEQEVEVVPYPLTLVVLAPTHLELFELSECLLPHLVGHRRALDPLPVVAIAGGALDLAEFFPDHPELLPKQRLPVCFPDLLGGLPGHLDLEGDALVQVYQEPEERVVALLNRDSL